MPTLNSDHNHFALAHSRATSPPAGYDAFLHPPIDQANPPPALHATHIRPHTPTHSFNQLPAQALRPFPSFDERTLTANVNHFSADSFHEDALSDPHDFYRHYQNGHGRGPIDGLGQSDLIVVTGNDNMAAQRQPGRTNPGLARISGMKLAPLSSRVHSNYGSRNPSTSSSEISPGAATKPTAMAPITSRNRQTSLQDLVNRFNQTPDELPPLPRKSASRSTSTNSNNPSSTHHARPRALSQSKKSGAGTTGKGDVPDQVPGSKAPRLHHRRSRRGEEKEIGSLSAKSSMSPRTIRPDPNAYATQSMTDLHPANLPCGRKPLFGEVLPSGMNHGDVGYGIPGPRRRRGSEGSMHSPNPMFPDELQPRRVSPSSPSAWYRGVTQTLEEIKMEKVIPSLPPKMHRRTRSDFLGLLPRKPAPPPLMAESNPSSYQAPHSPPESPTPLAPSVPTMNPAYRRESQSRIPISSRRLSINSDSGNSSPSTRTNSALERHSAQFTAPKSGSAIPKPAAKARSPVRTCGPAPPRNSPRRGDYSPRQRPATSPRLAAYISAPLPQKSPPLRSSRPRLPVSSASTSASRARAVDRIADRDGEPNNARAIRSKRPPELGAVDFAARRQKIQQAFTKTVKENERQEIEAEKKRMSMAHESGSAPPGGTMAFPEQPLVVPALDNPSEGHVLVSGIPVNVEEPLSQPPGEAPSRTERELVVDTEGILHRPMLDLNQEDSPTLGGFHQYTDSKGADGEPLSALTTSTSNSVDTFFDHEPQEDSPDSYFEHQTLFNQIIQMRDDDSTCADDGAPALTTEESASEKDDQESIQIMLGETPVLERTPHKGPFQGQAKEPDFEAAPGDRCSVSSWASSTRSNDPKTSDREKNAPTQKADEHTPNRSHASAHLSVSTASPNQTPQPWSPAMFASPLTNRTTMDSDTYSTINRVLDHYHDQSVLSPDLNNKQQHLITQSPDLARQGGWDPKRVTQLYLQELARARNSQNAGAPSSVVTQNRKHVVSDSIIHEEPAGLPIEKQVVEELAEKELMPPRASLDVVQNDSNPHRASLNAPADWDMSPSITDWIHLQAESPSDERGGVAAKDWNNVDDRGSAIGGFGSQVKGLPADFRPELPEIRGTGEGLGIGGLSISVTEPQDDDSPIMPTPPLPDHLPPPPPIDTSIESVSSSADVMSPPSPSVYSNHVSCVFPTEFSSDQVVTADSEETHRPPVPGTSTLPSVRSSMSREAPSTVTSSETAAKLPPSPDQKRLIRRRHIIKELVDTEHSFGQDMKVVDDIYRGTSNVIIVTAEDVKTLFSNSDQIVVFSTNFLDALKQAAKGVYTLPKCKRWRSDRTSNATSYSCNTDDQSSISGGELTDEERDRKTFIGEAFGHHMTSMEKVYGDYLKNHDAANEKLQALQKNPKVQIWLKECRAYAHDLTSAWDLDSLLVKPVQRILKYPLLLDQLLEVTPENHPDFVKLDVAAREMKGIPMRINEMKKRADLMEQVANNRKRKESDVRIGLSKAFGRRTEKLRQQVGLSDLVEDKGYAAISEKFGSHFFQLQVVMRDVEMYTNDVQQFMTRFADFILAIEAHIDVGQTSFPEVESKWRKLRMSTREISTTALPDHIAAVRKTVIEPMTTLLKLHDGPQKFMQKRNKRLLDYARYKAITDRGEKPDKKLAEQGEQFIAINDTLKEELPKLFALTGKLVESCLNNFVQLQRQWNVIWPRKLSQAIDDRKVPSQVSDIVDSFAVDFAYSEAQVLALGICNGSMLADAVNLVSLLSPSTTMNGDGAASPAQMSTLDLTKRRTLSISSDRSPMLPQPDFGARNFSVEHGLQLSTGVFSLSQDTSNRRGRASSTVSSNQGPRTPEIPGAYRSYFNSIPNPARPIPPLGRTTTEPVPSLARTSLEVPSVNRISGETLSVTRPQSGATYPPGVLDSGSFVEPTTSPAGPAISQRDSSPASRFSGLFSSAMPMSDSPPAQSPAEPPGRTEFKVLFLAASVYEFNIDRARKEAGYPYLTYVAGEIFDVIGEKGELWLSKNQDDATNQVGWIWNKHFVKLAS